MRKTLLVYADYAELRKKGDRIFIQTPTDSGFLPPNAVDGILIFGKAKISTDLISLCMREKIPLIIATKNGLVKAQIFPPVESRFTRLRLFQCGLYFKQRLEVAKFIVLNKIQEIEDVFDLDLSELRLAIRDVSDFSALLGLEGSASRFMFNEFSKGISQKNFEFHKREYNPPPDEANALLSFLYTLGYNLTLSFLLLRGYDPYISFLHVRRGDHASFASDVLEVLRPMLTHLCMEIILNDVVKKEDFQKTEKGFFLKKPALERITEAFFEKKEDTLDLLKAFFKDFEERFFQKSFPPGF